MLKKPARNLEKRTSRYWLERVKRSKEEAFRQRHMASTSLAFTLLNKGAHNNEPTYITEIKEFKYIIPMRMPMYIMDPMSPNSRLLIMSFCLICTDAAAKLPWSKLIIKFVIIINTKRKLMTALL